MAPAATLATVGERWAARWRGSTTPVTPAHSALRSRAPRLRGSVTPETTRRNGSPRSPLAQLVDGTGSIGRARARTPWGASVRAAVSRRARRHGLHPDLAPHGQGLDLVELGGGVEALGQPQPPDRAAACRPAVRGPRDAPRPGPRRARRPRSGADPGGRGRGRPPRPGRVRWAWRAPASAPRPAGGPGRRPCPRCSDAGSPARRRGGPLHEKGHGQAGHALGPRPNGAQALGPGGLDRDRGAHDRRQPVRHGSRCGAARRGASATTVQSALTTSRPAGATRAATAASSARLSAPAQAGSVVGEVCGRGRPGRPRRAGRRPGRGPGRRRRCARPARRPRATTTPAQHQRPGRVVAKGWTSNPWPMRTVTARQEVLRRRRGRPASVSFRFVRVPGHDHDRSAERLDQRGVVGGLVAAGVGPPQQLRHGRPGGSGRPPGRGGPPSPRPPGSPGPPASRCRTPTRRRRHPAVGSAGQRADHGGEQGRGGQGPGGVVDDDDLGVGGDGGQAPADRGRAGRSPPATARSAPKASLAVPGGSTTTTPSATEPTGRHRRVRPRGVPAKRSNCLGRPKRVPMPAATTTAQTGVRPVASATALRQGSASFRRCSAVSSSTPRAKVSSETRIWRARDSIRFSPADRPLSLSRIERFRTTSATW